MNDIGSVKSVKGCSTALNGQSGDGAEMPKPRGNTSPGGTNPGRNEPKSQSETAVRMPTGGKRY
jgi:hypothetical protein